MFKKNLFYGLSFFFALCCIAFLTGSSGCDDDGLVTIDRDDRGPDKIVLNLARVGEDEDIILIKREIDDDETSLQDLKLNKTGLTTYSFAASGQNPSGGVKKVMIEIDYDVVCYNGVSWTHARDVGTLVRYKLGEEVNGKADRVLLVTFNLNEEIICEELYNWYFGRITGCSILRFLGKARAKVWNFNDEAELRLKPMVTKDIIFYVETSDAEVVEVYDRTHKK